MKRICVFCGSSSGNSPFFIQSAKKLGVELAKQNITLVYGGASIGLMGAVAKSVMDNGGEVIGIIPKKLAQKNVSLTTISKLEIVDSMHDRKARMAELADAFIALPGGIGTFEEIFEALTWLQLGYHSKPCGVLNIDGYYNLLLDFLENSVSSGFLKPEHKEMLQVHSDSGILIEKLEKFQPLQIEKWLDNL